MSTAPSEVLEPGGVVQATPPPDPQRAPACSYSLSCPRYRQAFLVGLFFVMIVFFFVLERPDTYPDQGNIENLINSMPVLAVMAIAVTIMLVLGEFDLSVPNVAALASLIVALLLTQSGLRAHPRHHHWGS